MPFNDHKNLICLDPSIIRDPKDTVGVIGQEVFLQCIIAGSSPTSVTWHKDGTTVKINSRRIQDVKLDVGGIAKMLHTLTIKRAISKDAGIYKCVANNKNGMATSKGANISFAGRCSTGIARWWWNRPIWLTHCYNVSTQFKSPRRKFHYSLYFHFTAKFLETKVLFPT